MTTTENGISGMVLDICAQIHGQYGPGLLKSVYEDILSYELEKREIKFVRQYPIDLIHDGVLMNVGFQADIVIEDELLVELRDTVKQDELDISLVRTYIRLAGISEGLLVNFSQAVFEDGVRKIVNDLENNNTIYKQI